MMMLNKTTKRMERFIKGTASEDSKCLKDKAIQTKNMVNNTEILYINNQAKGSCIKETSLSKGNENKTTKTDMIPRYSNGRSL